MDQENAPFQLEEATIAEMHEAIRSGKTTLVKIVQRYIDRARTYNGVSSLLLTEDGAAVPGSGRGCARNGAAAVSDRDRESLKDPARSRQI